MKQDDILLEIYRATDCTEEEHSLLPHYIEQAKIFARLTASCVFLIDYKTCSIPYVSSRVIGKKCAEELQRDSYNYFANRMIYDEIQKFKEASRASFNFISRLPVEERMKYTLSFDFHIIEDNVKLLLYRHVTPLALTANGNIWLLMGVIAPSSNIEPGTTILRNSENGDCYQFDYESHVFQKIETFELDEIDRKILILSAQGLKVEEIAQRLYKSPDTIRTRKQKLFALLRVNNIAEALAKTRNFMLY